LRTTIAVRPLTQVDTSAYRPDAFMGFWVWLLFHMCRCIYSKKVITGLRFSLTQAGTHTNTLASYDVLTRLPWETLSFFFVIWVVFKICFYAGSTLLPLPSLSLSLSPTRADWTSHTTFSCKHGNGTRGEEFQNKIYGASISIRAR
jgi:hypothetical protein